MYYWEDFKVGDTSALGEKVVDKEETIAFATAYDPQPFHIDETAAKESFFGELVMSMEGYGMFERRNPGA